MNLNVEGKQYWVEFEYTPPRKENGRHVKGQTWCTVWAGDSRTSDHVYRGYALQSKKDEHSPKIGNLVALGRAIPDKALRRKFVHAYTHRPKETLRTFMLRHLNFAIGHAEGLDPELRTGIGIITDELRWMRSVLINQPRAVLRHQPRAAATKKGL